MIQSFLATVGAAEQMDDLGVYVVAVAEGDDGNGRRLEIQQALEYDESDKAAGMDTYCLCTEMGSSHYGGVVSWSINGVNLKIILDAEAASNLGLDVELYIKLDMPAEKIRAVSDGLVKVLGSP
jgi:hypothetical protein